MKRRFLQQIDLCRTMPGPVKMKDVSVKAACARSDSNRSIAGQSFGSDGAPPSVCVGSVPAACPQLDGRGDARAGHRPELTAGAAIDDYQRHCMTRPSQGSGRGGRGSTA